MSLAATGVVSGFGAASYELAVEAAAGLARYCDIRRKTRAEHMATTPKAPADPIDSRLVRKLADILTETGLTEIEVEQWRPEDPRRQAA